MNVLSSLLNFIGNRAVFKDENGNASVSGHIYAEGHGSYIGYHNEGSGSRSIASGSLPVELISGITIGAGTWLLVANAEFPAGEHIRHIDWRKNTTAVPESRVTENAVSESGFSSRLQSTIVVELDASTTMRVYCYQNSGSSATVSFNWSITRIA